MQLILSRNTDLPKQTIHRDPLPTTLIQIPFHDTLQRVKTYTVVLCHGYDFICSIVSNRFNSSLHAAKEYIPLYNVGQRIDSPQWALEQRCSDLYGLFAEHPESAGMEPKRRVIVY